MIIDITQNKISFASRYNISIDGVDKYKAKGKSFSFLGDDISITDATGCQIGLIEKQFYLIRPFYKIGLMSGQKYDFRSISIWKSIFACICEDTKYTFYKHKGHLSSIFKGDSQVAVVARDPIKILKGDKYNILADDDVDELLIISLVIIYDDYSHKYSNGDIGTIDLGNILLEGKEFDGTWKPKIALKT